MGTMNHLDSIDAIYGLLFPDNGDNEVKINVSFRGRKFSANGEEFRLNDLVKQVQAVSQIGLINATQGPVDKMEQIINKIKLLDLQGQEVLDKKNVLIKALTFFCKLFGNLFFDRADVLEEVRVDVRANQVRLTREGKYQIFAKSEEIAEKKDESFASQRQEKRESTEIENVLEDTIPPVESRPQPPKKIEKHIARDTTSSKQEENPAQKNESKEITIKLASPPVQKVSQTVEMKEEEPPKSTPPASTTASKETDSTTGSKIEKKTTDDSKNASKDDKSKNNVSKPSDSQAHKSPVSSNKKTPSSTPSVTPRRSQTPQERERSLRGLDLETANLLKVENKGANPSERARKSASLKALNLAKSPGKKEKKGRKRGEKDFNTMRKISKFDIIKDFRNDADEGTKIEPAKQTPIQSKSAPDPRLGMGMPPALLAQLKKKQN